MAYTQAGNKAVQRYVKKAYDRITVTCRKGDREKYQKIAASRGMSLNALIVSLLEKECKDGANGRVK